MNLHEIKVLRKFFLPILKKINIGDISIRHHFTNDSIKLHFFKHKGYWYHGRKREKESMALFSKLVNKNDTVVEIGGHIGYISLFLAKLIGDSGKLFVFEPGENNLPYIRKNIKGKENICLVEKAISEKAGTVSFFIDDLTGQNNSLNKDYEVFKNNNKASYTKSAYQEVIIQAITLDDFVSARNLKVDFIKMDIEGAEILAVRGMQKILIENPPIMMIEITDGKEEIFNILVERGYILINEAKKEIKTFQNLSHNIFCLHKQKHKLILEDVFKLN